jgi:hypothetical protein
MGAIDVVIKIRKNIIIAVFGAVLLGVICFFALPHLTGPSQKSADKIVAGGVLHSLTDCSGNYAPAISQSDGSERFQRPSGALPYPNPYSFADFRKPYETPPLVTKKFDDPEDLILAYYGILKEASNMLGYSGGCGTVGWSTLPYPYAYELLSEEKRDEIPLDLFVDSFSGIGHITLLKLLPAYSPAGTPDDTRYFMVEIEVITGAEVSSEADYGLGSRFAYYYGLITTIKAPDGSWRIDDIGYIAEDFLCAPTHGWFYFSEAVVQIVYGENLKLIEQIDKTERDGDIVSVYASGNGKSYRFDFVRLTNGYDILLHEYLFYDGVWKETSLLTDDWKYLKLSIENDNLRKAV